MSTDDPPQHPPAHPPAHPHVDPHLGFPIDSDVTVDEVRLLPHPAVRVLRERWDILLAIAAGGALGAAARWALAEAIPHGPGQVPWATLRTNVVGCLALGVLLVLLTEKRPDSRLLRPLLGTGVLGGFTTFSTYALDTRTLAANGRPALAAAYLFGTLVLGLLAMLCGLRLADRMVR
jgi:CrcB protein